MMPLPQRSSQPAVWRFRIIWKQEFSPHCLRARSQPFWPARIEAPGSVWLKSIIFNEISDEQRIGECAPSTVGSRVADPGHQPGIEWPGFSREVAANRISYPGDRAPFRDSRRSLAIALCRYHARRQAIVGLPDRAAGSTAILAGRHLHEHELASEDRDFPAERSQ